MLPQPNTPRRLRLRAAALLVLPCMACADLVGLNELEDHGPPSDVTGGRSGASAGSGGLGPDASASGGTGGRNNSPPGSGGHLGGAGAAGAAGADSGGASGGAAGAPSDGRAGSDSGNQAGAAGSGGGAPECSLADPFTDEAYTRRCWQLYNANKLMAPPAVGQGTLALQPHERTHWWDSSHSFLLYQSVKGPFRLDVRVSVEHNASGADLAALELAGGGVLIADHLADPGALERYYATQVGFYAHSAGELRPGVYAELTVSHPTSGSYSYREEYAFEPAATLRVCRFGSYLWTGYRDREGRWQHVKTSDCNDVGCDTARPDLPSLGDEVLVGLLAQSPYLRENQAIVPTVSFRDLRFDRIASFDECLESAD